MIFPKNKTVVVTDLPKAKGIGKAVNILIMEDISTWWGVNRQDVYLALKGQQNVTEINVYMSTLGGDVNEALNIHDMLKGHPAKVTMHLVGIVASAGTIIACAGDEIIMSRQCLYMIHEGSWFARGRSSDLRKAADVLDQFNDIIVDLYVRQTGLDSENVAALMDYETWFSASQAKELGFVTEVVDTIELDFELEAVGDQQSDEDDVYYKHNTMTEVMKNYTSGISASLQNDVFPLKCVSKFSNNLKINPAEMKINFKNLGQQLIGLLTAQGFIDSSRYDDAVKAVSDAPGMQIISDEEIKNAIQSQLSTDMIINLIKSDNDARAKVLESLGLSDVNNKIAGLTSEISNLKKPGSAKAQNNGVNPIEGNENESESSTKTSWNESHLKMMFNAFKQGNVTAKIVKDTTGMTPDQIKSKLQSLSGIK